MKYIHLHEINPYTWNISIYMKYQPDIRLQPDIHEIYQYTLNINQILGYNQIYIKSINIKVFINIH